VPAELTNICITKNQRGIFVHVIDSYNIKFGDRLKLPKIDLVRDKINHKDLEAP
jgi:hypothetical protein